MHRQTLLAGPDFHRALSLAHLHRGAHPLPVDPVSGGLPADKAVPRHQPVFPQVGRQPASLRQLPQMRLFLGQHLRGRTSRGSMGPPVGDAVAPLQGLSVQVGIIGEAQAGPQVATHVLHPALHLALGLGPVGLAQAQLKAQPQGEVQHPPVPLGTALLIPAQGHHLGVVIETAPGHPAKVFKGIDVALDEAGRVRPLYKFHVDGSRPAEHHHEGPHLPLATLFVHVAEASPVHLGLFPCRCLKSHRGLRLAATAAGSHVIRHRAIAAFIPHATDLPQQHSAILQPLGNSVVNVVGVWVQPGAPQGPRLRCQRLRRVQVLEHRITGQSQPLGYRTGRITPSLQFVDLFHFSTS